MRWTLFGMSRWSERNWALHQLSCPPTARQMADASQKGKQYCAKIDGLEPEQMYDFQVAAHTLGSHAYGTLEKFEPSTNQLIGAWSHPESARTGSGPVKIMSVEKAASGGDFLDVKWTVKPADRARVTEYRVG